MKKKGFTIVELVIVIAIIGILSAILIPTFAGLTKKAEEAALQTNLRNAYYAYSAEYADSADLVAEKDAILSSVDNLASGQKAYKLVVSNDGQWSWSEETITVGTGYTLTLLDADAFNGYYVYTIEEAPSQP